MSNIQILRLNGRGNSFCVKNCKSKREREYLIKKVEKAVFAYRRFYKLIKCIGI